MLGLSRRLVLSLRKYYDSNYSLNIMDDDRYYSNTYDVSHPHEDLGSILIALIFKRYNLCAMVELKR